MSGQPEALAAKGIRSDTKHYRGCPDEGQPLILLQHELIKEQM